MHFKTKGEQRGKWGDSEERRVLRIQVQGDGGLVMVLKIEKVDGF